MDKKAIKEEDVFKKRISKGKNDFGVGFSTEVTAITVKRQGR